MFRRTMELVGFAACMAGVVAVIFGVYTLGKIGVILISSGLSLLVFGSATINICHKNI